MDGVGPSGPDHFLPRKPEIIERTLVEPDGVAVLVGDPRKLRQLFDEVAPQGRRKLVRPAAGQRIHATIVFPGTPTS